MSKMMRLAVIIVALAATAAGVVRLRTRQIAVGAEIRRLEGERLRVRRRLWDQQLLMARAGSLPQAQARGDRWALDLTGPDQPKPPGLARVTPR